MVKNGSLWKVHFRIVYSAIILKTGQQNDLTLKNILFGYQFLNETMGVFLSISTLLTGQISKILGSKMT